MGRWHCADVRDRWTFMNELQIKSAGVQHRNEILLELSDGRVLTFSLEKLLTLTPDVELTPGSPELHETL